MRGVIFDVDGVLVDSAKAHWQSWQLLAKELGREVSEDAFATTFGRQNKDIIPLFFGYEAEEDVRRIADRKEQLYRDLVRNNVPAVDGAADLVRACREAGFKLAVGSSAPPENVDLVLECMKIDAHFDARITAEQVSRGKPDPQVFELAAAALNLPPGRCVVIEDAPAGVEAGVRSGAAVIALAGGYAADVLDEAHHVVTSLRQVTPSLIRELINRNDAA